MNFSGQLLQPSPRAGNHLGSETDYWAQEEGSGEGALQHSSQHLFQPLSAWQLAPFQDQKHRFDCRKNPEECNGALALHWGFLLHTEIIRTKWKQISRLSVWSNWLILNWIRGSASPWYHSSCCSSVQPEKGSCVSSSITANPHWLGTLLNWKAFLPHKANVFHCNFDILIHTIKQSW